MNGFFMGLFNGVGLYMAYMAFWGSDIEQKIGMDKVASGQYECTLEVSEDKTTEWVCAELVNE